jgi:hypothetical protein
MVGRRKPCPDSMSVGGNDSRPHRPRPGSNTASGPGTRADRSHAGIRLPWCTPHLDGVCASAIVEADVARRAAHGAVGGATASRARGRTRRALRRRFRHAEDEECSSENSDNDPPTKHVSPKAVKRLNYVGNESTGAPNPPRPWHVAIISQVRLGRGGAAAEWPLIAPPVEHHHPPRFLGFNRGS